MVDPKRPAPEITTAVPSRAALPADRAFVVQLRADADLARGAISGRIEHMSSGDAALFESVEQLVGCLREAVARHSGRPQGV